MDNSNDIRNGILWLKLDARSKQLLQQRFPAIYPNTFYDHVTLAYGTTKIAVAELIGKSDSVQAYAYAKNEKAEAVRVNTRGLPDTYGAPHITLSTADGVEPFESVTMLKSDHHETKIAPLELSGVLEFIYL